jgi:GNAT superfamily N-acetyltransferase
MFALLTGLSPFYEESRRSEVERRVAKGVKAFVDPRWRNRTFAERTLCELIDRCWERDLDKRVDVFTLVRLLRNAYRTVIDQYLHEDKSFKPFLRAL